MWSIALLINTSTWHEFKNNWKLICLVFLQLHLGEDHLHREHQDSLLDKISKIKSDTNTIDAIELANLVEGDNETELSTIDVYHFDDDEGNDGIEPEANVSKSTKKKV